MGNLRDKLKGYYVIAKQSGSVEAEGYRVDIDEWVDQILSTIRQELEASLPEKELEVITEGIIRVSGRDVGYNQALSDATKAIRKVLGE